MYTIKEWFELVESPSLRQHLLSRLDERNKSIQDRIVKDFPTALNYGFSWSGRARYYNDLFHNPPKLKNPIIYRLKLFINDLN